MRLCRYQTGSARPQVGFFHDDRLVPLRAAAARFGMTARDDDSLLACLPGGESFAATQEIFGALERDGDAGRELALPTATVQLLVPVPQPPKLLLLAGNYAKHIEERGGKAEERERTFPYVFMKPPSTTLQHPGGPVVIPACSPDSLDWELELGVVIGRRCRGVSEAEALQYVAGYTVVNDISDRQYRPNPGRAKRERDAFFDWQHGKWHDTSCPLGPCVLSSDACPDPQTLRMQLKLNGQVEQDASTAEMVFPVAAVIEFISRFVTLEPGDIISTGTPAGVGSSKNKYLKPGDLLEATIERIGTLTSPVVAEVK
jgi:2,4-didehydro-3-deoxy-L-rhamnonate hydrolase